MMNNAKVERFSSNGFVLVAKKVLAHRRDARAFLEAEYLAQPGYDALRVVVDGVVVDYLGVYSTSHLDHLYAAVRDGSECLDQDAFRARPELSAAYYARLDAQFARAA